MSSLWLRLDGLPATEIAAHTPPTWETWADGGCGAASVEFALSRRSQHQALRRRALFEIMAGPYPVYRGLTTEPDRTTWQVTAYGLGSALHKILALDGSGNATRDIGVAVQRAIDVGWPGFNPALVDGTPAGDTDGNPVTVGTLLDDYADETGQRWGVDGRGVLWMQPDPIVPSLLAAPGTAVFGETTDSTPDRLAGRYFNGTDNVTAYAGADEPEQEESVDLTDRGTLTQPEAEAILAGMLIRKGSQGWTNSVTLDREQLTTIGGQPANLAATTAPHMLRGQGVSSARAALRLDVVIGKTTHTAGARTITLEPINTAPRTLRGSIAAA